MREDRPCPARVAQAPAAQARCASAGSSTITNTSVKNRSTAGRNVAASVNARAVVALREHAAIAGAARSSSASERLLGGLDERRATTRVGDLARRQLARDVLDALEERGELREVGGAANRPAAPRADAAPRAARGRHRLRLQHRVDLVAAIAALLEHVRNRSDAKARKSALGAATSADANPAAAARHERVEPNRAVDAADLRQVHQDLDAPCACRRSPNGSREPVGRSPAANKPTSVSSLSASDTAAHVTPRRRRAARASAARPPRRRSAGTGSRWPSRRASG